MRHAGLSAAIAVLCFPHATGEGELETKKKSFALHVGAGLLESWSSCFRAGSSESEPLNHDGEESAVCRVMGPLWSTASRRLESTTSEPSCAYIDKFYQPSCQPTKSEPCTAEYQLPPNSVNVHFERVYKNANNQVRCNLENWEQEVPPSEKDSILNSSEPATIHFTFVREPLGRFVAGYSEIEYRYGTWNLAEPYRDETIATEARANSFIRDLFGGRLLDMHPVYQHIRTQSATMKATSCSVIGTLESFDEGWSRLEKIVGMNYTWDWDCDRHVVTDSSSDGEDKEFGPRVSMENELELHEGVAISLQCAFLLPDYVCLGYSLAEEDCVAAGFAADHQAWAKIVDEVRSVHCPAGIDWVD